MDLSIIDTYRFPRPTKEFHYNGAILEYRNKYLFAWRRDIYDANYVETEDRKFGNTATISICELGRDFQPIDGSDRQITIPDTLRCGNRFEDPRLLVHQGQLCCAFANVAKKFNATSQGICKLTYSRKNKHIIPNDVWYPIYGKNIGGAVIEEKKIWHPEGYLTTFGGTRTVEKNWGFFSRENRLYFVYTIQPHVVVEMEYGAKQPAQEFKFDFCAPHWTWGELRGGSPPFLYEGQYYSFFHSSYRYEGQVKLVYAMGVYAFEPEPPFRVTAVSKEPLLTGDIHFTQEKDRTPCVFPVGVIKKPGQWLVSLGYHDCLCKIARFRDQEIRDNLLPLRQQGTQAASS